MRKCLLVAALASMVICTASGSAGAAGMQSRAGTASPKQFCDVVQNPLVATAAGLLAKLLPKKYQPSVSIKTVIGAVVAACPQLAKAAVKVHEAYVTRFSPNSNRSAVYQPWVSLLATDTMNLSNGAASAFVSWSGVNVSHYQEQTHVGPSVDPPLTVGGSSLWVYRTVVPGGVYQFWVRGLDARGGALTTWARSVPFTLRVYDTRVNLRGWTTQTGRTAYGGTLVYANASSRPPDVEYTADGWAVALVGPTYPAGGTADIYVDGRFARTISFYSPTVQVGRLVFSWSWSSPVRHYITLRPRSGQIALDAGLVLAPA